MPKVVHDFRGRKPPSLQVLKNERMVLATAARLCDTICKLVAGHHAELAEKTGRLSRELEELAQIETHDLTKPF